jgi:Base plate wedge protein 53
VSIGKSPFDIPGNNILSTSPLAMRLVHEIDGKLMYNPIGNINFIGVDESASLPKYEVKQGDTWPMISYKLYGTTRLWWVIAQVNSVIDPFTDPFVDISTGERSAGNYIKYLPLETVNTIVREVSNVPPYESRTN